MGRKWPKGEVGLTAINRYPGFVARRKKYIILVDRKKNGKHQ